MFRVICLLALSGVTLAAVPGKTLVEVPLNTNEIHKLRKAVPTLDRDDFESVGDSDVTIWADEIQINQLLEFGFNVNRDVIDISSINAKAALSQTVQVLERNAEPNWSQFMNYPAMETYLMQLSQECSMYSVKSIGSTNDRREIYVVEITSNNGPEVLMAGNIHGDETTGGQLLLHFLWDLCHNPNNDARLNEILNTVHLFVMPMFNPDGYMRNRRGNANNQDLNRNFPNRISSPTDTTNGRQTETGHYMNFASDRNFKISIMYHGGALVANYAYDSVPYGTPGGTYSPTDRDALVRRLAIEYASNHTTMWRSNQFPQGAVNGAQWYVIYGSLQDFMYDYRGSIDLTLEVSSNKWPAGSTLPGHYRDNYNAIATYILNGKIV